MAIYYFVQHCQVGVLSPFLESRPLQLLQHVVLWGPLQLQLTLKSAYTLMPDVTATLEGESNHLAVILPNLVYVRETIWFRLTSC